MAKTSKDDVLNSKVGAQEEGPLPIAFVQTGRVQEIAYEEGMTIAAALKAFGVTVGKGQELRLNNRPITDRDATLRPGDQLLVAGQISGG